MYPLTESPPPLTHQEFYLLLALARQETYAYRLGTLIAYDSQGSVKMSRGTLYPLIRRLIEHGFVTPAGHRPAGKTGSEPMHYALSPDGRERLREELIRMQQALELGNAAQLGNEKDFPPDIQRMLNSIT